MFKGICEGFSNIHQLIYEYIHLKDEPLKAIIISLFLIFSMVKLWKSLHNITNVENLLPHIKIIE